MGTYLDIDGDPNQVGGTGAVLQGLAETFRAKTLGIRDKIAGVEGDRPWGSDKFGHAFETTYNQVPEGASTSLRDSVSDGLLYAGESLSRLGGNVVRAMNQYQGEDHANATGLKQSDTTAGHGVHGGVRRQTPAS